MVGNKRVTSQDVAREAGVSRTTVSYILNNTPHQSISDSTRQRVLEAAQSLNYTPMASARILRRGRSDIVIMLLPNWPVGSAIERMIEHVAEYLSPHGLMLVTHTHLRQRALDDVWRAITPAAVVRIGELGSPEDEQLRRATIGVLVEVGSSEESGLPLSFPLQRMGRLQAEHLIATGHRKIGYATAHDPRLTVFRDNRLHGVRQTCLAHGLAAPDLRTVGLDAQNAADTVTSWLRGGIAGVCAYNDDLAMAILAGVRRVGLRVPDDLAVIGVDDIPLAGLADPTLTTVRADTRRFGEIIADHVVRGIAGESSTMFVQDDLVELVIRESA